MYKEIFIIWAYKCINKIDILTFSNSFLQLILTEILVEMHVGKVNSEGAV